MLKHGVINPLNVFGLRKLEHCPPHFERVTFELKCTNKDITDWIYENLEGRFWIGDNFVKETSTLNMCAGFEHHGEASYFALLLDKFNINKWDILL